MTVEILIYHGDFGVNYSHLLERLKLREVLPVVLRLFCFWSSIPQKYVDFLVFLSC